jgi:hypothetical protein
MAKREQCATIGCNGILAIAVAAAALTPRWCRYASSGPSTSAMVTMIAMLSISSRLDRAFRLAGTMRGSIIKYLLAKQRLMLPCIR